MMTKIIIQAEAEKNIVPMQTKEKEMKRKGDDEEAEKRRKEEVKLTLKNLPHPNLEPTPKPQT